ncbi:unnamed protein product [Onchocerca ochengi]|uniref:GLOBIN domain-containing protein n=2 Tax=Onchocerca TaxID=6281 RepID=A0A182E4W1_ONCOC|nr:unnamed protein product [Onchocerca ochengi]
MEDRIDMSKQFSKKHQFIMDALFKAEPNHFFRKEFFLTVIQVNRLSSHAEIIIMAIKSQNILHERERRHRDLMLAV